MFCYYNAFSSQSDGVLWRGFTVPGGYSQSLLTGLFKIWHYWLVVVGMSMRRKLWKKNRKLVRGYTVDHIVVPEDLTLDVVVVSLCANLYCFLLEVFIEVARFTG